MKKALKVTFGTMLAVSMVAPNLAAAHEHITNHLAVWVEGTYTKPSNNGLSVGDSFFAGSQLRGAFPVTGPLNTLDGGRRHVFLEPDNEFDWAAGISYRLPHTHTRVFFSYDHYDNDVDDQGDINLRNIGFAVDNLVSGNGNPANDGLSNFNQNQAVASMDLNSHEFRVGAIHDLHFGDHFCLDLLAFFEYDKVRQTVEETNTKFINNPGGIEVRRRETENKVRGFGPGVGFMTRWYAHNPHWSIFAGANTSLIAADNDFSQAYFQDGNNFYIYEPEESDSLVGKLDINFGINYRCAFKHEMHGMAWDIALGMRYMNMFNAFKNGNTAWNPNAELTNGGGGANGDFVANFAANLGPAQDWGRYGPFLKFKIGGAHS